jgi:hypothetical protein
MLVSLYSMSMAGVSVNLSSGYDADEYNIPTSSLSENCFSSCIGLRELAVISEHLELRFYLLASAGGHTGLPFCKPAYP